MRSIKSTLIFILIFPITISSIRGQHVDIDWLREANVHRNKSLDPLMRTSSYSVLPIVLGVPLTELTIGLIHKDSAQFSKGISTLGAASINYLITSAMKASISRDRPFESYSELDPLYYPTDGSFPSGHTSGSFAIATSLSMNYPKWYVILPAYTWAGLVGYSRMHLGVHYPSDVFCGAIIGSGSAVASHYLNKWVQQKYSFTSKLRLENKETLKYIDLEVGNDDDMTID